MKKGAYRYFQNQSRLEVSDYPNEFDHTLTKAGILKNILNVLIGTWTGAKPQDQFFSYDMDSSMRSNSFVGTYDYSGSPVVHAPKRITGGDIFTYDANGNMTTGLHGKVMTYDGEIVPSL